MQITNEQFKSTALDYISGLSKLSGRNTERIVESLIQSITANRIDELPKQDFELLVNQFFNLVCFGPITNLELIVTEDCNLACDYCFVREKNHNNMSLETIITAINLIRREMQRKFSE